MAVLALGLAGAAVGSAFGYASIGWMVGSTVGSLLFQQKEEIKREGPRLNDLRVQASTYGVGIPICYGSVRIAGNLIWSGGIREIVAESTEEVGKGGGQEVTTRTYSYLSSFAIALCAGPVVGIRRVWADGELIYYSNTTDLTQISGSVLGLGNATFYAGSETQLPDPTIESYEGAGNVPGHRGMAYAVFADADITKWGRVPNLEFEVVVSGSTSRPSAVSVAGNAAQAGYLENGLFRTARTDATLSPSTVTVFRTLSPTGAILDTQTWTNTTFSHSGTWGTNLVQGNILGLCAAFNSSTNGVWMRALADGSYVANTIGLPGISNIGAPIQAYRIGDVVLTSHRNGTTRYLDFIDYDHAAGLPQSTPFLTIPFACVDTNEASRWKISSDGTYFYVANFNTGNFARGLRKYDTAGNLVDSWTFPSISDADFNGFCVVDDLYFVWKISGSTNGFLAQLFAGGVATVLNSSHTVTYPGAPAIPATGYAWTDSGAANLLPAVTQTAPALSTIASDICTRAGLDASDLTLTALTDTVNGFAVTRPMTARSALEALQKGFFFDLVESDAKLKAVKRGGASAVTIAAADLGAVEVGNGPADLVTVERADETEAPRQVTVQFWNNDGSYAQATEYARRLVVRSVEQVFEQLPIVFTPDQGARVADVLLYAAHAARTRCQWATSVEYAKYEPTDVMTLQPSGSISYTVRATRKTEQGQRIVWEGELDNAAAYSSSASGATSQDNDLAIATVGPTLWEAMDIPILRDQDDDFGYYVALAGLYSGWRGGVLFDAPDDSNYAQIGGVSQGAAIGAATSTLGNFSGGNIWDELSNVTVSIVAGSIASATEAQVLAGANWALLGSEIIAFKNATLVSGTTYRLTGLLRGRFGTEQHMATHTSTDRFVLLLPAGMTRPARPSSELNTTRYLKGVSFGQQIGAVTAEAFTNTGAGKKPLAPVYLRGSRNGSSDLIATWIRRTRIGGEWRDYVDASLGEATEGYEIDIRNAGDTATLRTLTSSAQTVTYTAAQQTTDFGAPQSSINVRVYQMSATVGRGFAASGAL
jgi:hypothetical protein